MLNVLQVTTFFTEHGGVEKSVSELSHALAHQHSVSVLCTARGRTMHHTKGKVKVTAAGGQLALSGRPFSPAFIHHLGKHQVDVAHFHLPCPMALLANPFAKPQAKIKVATWHHDLVRHKLFNTMMRPLMDSFLSSMDSIIVTAPALIETSDLLQRYRRKCEVIPLGIDDTKFSADSIDHDAVLDLRCKYGAAPLILYVGRLVYYKGCSVLVKAMKQVPDAHLVMVGTGPLQDELKDLIEREGLSQRVHLLGWQNDESLRLLFQACDFFVLPSTLPTECFGLVQVEAMLCGKPVINTNLETGVPWVSLDQTTGLTVPPADPNALAAAIKKLVDEPELRKALGANARHRAQAMFTLRKQTTSTVELYERLLGKHAGFATSASRLA